MYVMTDITNEQRLAIWHSRRPYACALARQYGLDADDLMQSAWMAFSDAEIDPQRGDGRALLSTILHNHAVNAVRVRKRRRESFSPNGEPLDCADRTAAPHDDGVCMADEARRFVSLLMPILQGVGIHPVMLGNVVSWAVKHEGDTTAAVKDLGITATALRGQIRKVRTVARVVKAAEMQILAGQPLNILALLQEEGGAPGAIWARMWRDAEATTGVEHFDPYRWATEEGISPSTARQYWATARLLAHAAHLCAHRVQTLRTVGLAA